MKYLILLFISVLFNPVLFAQGEMNRTQKLRYFNHTQISGLVGEESEDLSRKAIIPSFQTTTGIYVGKHAGVGLGVGIEPFEYITFPVFAGGYFFMNDKKTSPYFAAKAGYAFSNSNKRLIHHYINGVYDNKGGVMVNPEIGLRIKMPYFDMTLSGGYRFQRLVSRITEDHSHYTYTRRVDYNRVTFALGIIF
ncbi:MAG: hypothetical protein LBE79_05555 [Tannerella sp.]|jgi:hypothetical protein|nr:hypothetical protein [Tannerella sp.]